MVAFLNGDGGNFEIVDTVPGGEGDVKEEDLNKVETPSFARELVRHLQLGSDQSQNQRSLINAG